MKAANSTAFADDVRLSFVTSLYQKRGTLFAGMIAHVVTTIAVYMRIDDPFYLYAALALFIIWNGRNIDMMAFDRLDKTKFKLAETLHWEKRYVAGSLIAAFVLGTVCGHALVVAQDPFAELVTISVTLATMISVVGRNFGSRLNVDMIILAACLPIMAGLIMARDPYMALMAVLLLPLFLTTRSMANGVRDFLFNAVTSERKASEIADRFDTALNNMSHGLFMLDGDGRIEVANRKAREFFNLDANVDLSGRILKAALRLGTRNGVIARENFAQINEHLDRLISGREDRSLVRLDKNSWLEFSARHRGEKGVVLIFEDVSARIQSEKRILHMARFDNLTGLPNRSWFKDVVAAKMAKARPDQLLALAVLDIDDFKHVNDTMGHVSGDKLLSAIANRLRSLSRQKFVISRFGGDEFVLFLPDVEDLSDLNRTMDHVIDTLRGTYMIDGHKLFISLSGGASMAPVAGAQIEDLHIQADLALYEAKRRDKNRWTLFEESMNQLYTERQRMKSDLREAIRTNSMDLFYQPMFNPEGKRIAGAEALSRWNHPQLGPISPAVYIPLAEEMGIIGDLTRCVIDKAAQECATWPDNLFVSVNLSAFDLGDRAIISVISDALDRNNLAPERLQLEITESGLMNDLETAQVILTELRAMGLSIAIDDFGTGYSSLSYLDMLPLNKVKIDRSFVSNVTTDMRKLKLLRGVVHLARELGLEVVVEGVETEAQLVLIRENDCADLIQGFIFGTPMPKGAFSELATKLSKQQVAAREQLQLPNSAKSAR
ncbi:MAG: EAL domain-containing protein [Hoeflea sp.]|uniref:putative bifunctional diguanylate cyclase/phosphodiesterase n=1 Tax=Hoeflea sp. TaxID=1940281 RepID=UPI001E02E0B0|nr:EAL domain-containing protein [Hoeflea sp.]MBU4528195.1 EAL domain-containing protein [Alphaproteobacteria bacterium]MBU4543791.1 EAL domain-containing protein [Alphaproteobacteria bacterium]MBU4548658.1 EAL domain-containing protein [Alphaproteobacteria bacterium]MBV1725824.1 EAL domain-containing protein [Hoeflea sp.]MBV1762180.1 EAL domain-containing protein [Hoeflea sp.]